MKKVIYVFSVDEELRNLCCNSSVPADLRFFSNYDILCQEIKKSKPNLILLDYKQLIRIGPNCINNICSKSSGVSLILLINEEYSCIAPFFLKFGLNNFIVFPCEISCFRKKLIPYLSEKEFFVTTENNDKIQGVPELNELLGNSLEMLDLKKNIINLACSDQPLLLLGESGTGKTHVAKIIHQLSNRKKAPFFAVNMATIPISLAESELFGTVTGAYTGATHRNGYFSSAEGGTLFLDEIGELPLVIQPKLLHVLEDKIFSKVGSTSIHSCNVRFIFATNSDLRLLMENHSFREDLYYRIATFPIQIPPLRDRKGDIPLLVNHFLKNQNKKMSDGGIQKLYDYHWPGNIRELKNCLARASVATNEEMILDMHISF